MLSLVLLVSVTALVDLCFGGVRLSLSQVFGADGEVARQILLQIRLPRMLCAVLSGCMLASSGMQMQAVFRNPLADPHILGISSGAALGASLVAGGSGAGGLTVAGSAFIGAILASACVLAVSAKFKGASVLLIFGVLLGFVFSAGTTITQYFSTEESLKLYHSWVSGSYVSCGWSSIAVMCCAAMVGLLLLLSNFKGLDSLLFGDDFAAAFNVPVGAVRRKSILSGAIMTAAVTAFCGPVGFVGIIAPHLVRVIFCTSVHRRLFVPVLLLGAEISVFADILSQSFSVPIPVGATMAVAGIPVVMWMLLRKRLW